MAKAREIKRRIRSIGSTKKITRTMEMVATAKSKVTQDRLKTLLPYSEDLVEMSAGLVGTSTHPLLLPREEVRKVALLVLTSNRGLCGGYNTNINILARDVLAREKEAGREVELHVSGKKGISYFTRRKVPIAQTYTHFEDKPTFAEADALAKPFLKRYMEGDLDRVILVYSRYHSAGDQRPGEVILLPLERDEGEGGRATVDYLYEPDPETILEALLPLSVSVGLLKALAESAASEQIARRVAMKLATDNAEDLLKFLTRRYNRARQAQITNELSEIMGGAEALR
jgi:F-type H+-transporting ATPase subunit gamma